MMIYSIEINILVDLYHKEKYQIQFQVTVKPIRQYLAVLFQFE